MKPIKAVYVFLCAACLVGVCLVYFVDVGMITSKFVDFTYSGLIHLKLINKNNYTEEEKAINHTDIESSVHFVQTTTASSLITQIKNNSRNPEVFANTTTMTFNTSLVVHCKQSPYIHCIPPIIKPLANKVFQITYLRRPTWLQIDLTSCKVNQCVITDGPVTNNTDVVVVYGVGLRDNFQPPQRSKNQTYILSVWESPIHAGSDYLKNGPKTAPGENCDRSNVCVHPKDWIDEEDGNSPWNAHINLIMSYRVDADIFVPYSHLLFTPKPLPDRPNYYEIAKNKTRTAVWLVSHCKTHSRREEYVKKMQKYVDVDILGNCGQSCNKSNSKCNDWPSKYKFYLSFENSLCTDYVTEKFFKIFDPSIYVIPVVRGGADYDKHFPNFTYINSAHFKTPKDLALHLKHLASDLETYSKYLEYKDLYMHSANIDQLCRLCSFVHTHTLPDRKTYKLRRWMNDRHCHISRDLNE